MQTPSKFGLVSSLKIYESHLLGLHVALMGQPLMLYRYFLYLHTFLNSIGATSGAQRAGCPRRRFRRNRILVDGVAGPEAGFRFAFRLFVDVCRLTLSNLLMFLNRRASCQGSVRRRRFLRCSGTIRGLHRRSGGHWKRFLSVRRAIHRCSLLVTVPLVVNTGEYQHIQHQQDATDSYSDRKSCGGAVIVTRSRSLQQFCVVFRVVQDRCDILGDVITGRRAARCRRRCAGFGCTHERQRSVPLVPNRSWKVRYYSQLFYSFKKTNRISFILQSRFYL